MIRLWRPMLLPICKAAQAKTILEIGVEDGTSTNVLLNYVRGNGGHLHCIDPHPAFDAEQFAQQNNDRITFYKNLSLDVLTQIPKVDVAMVDGDHNWYTVLNELLLIEQNHGSDAEDQPVIFAHDVSWPYGRRDLYYNPDTIPEEHRQSHAHKGMLPDQKDLVEEGGMNRDLCHAIQEGGAKNGVLTGVEDFIIQSKLKWRFVLLPLYYGLGILVTKEKLKANKALQQQLDRFDLSEGAKLLVQQAEHLRCTDGVVRQEFSKQLVAAKAKIKDLEIRIQGFVSQM